jgi:hypothetical protein
VITITGIGDHLRLEWPITITGMRRPEAGDRLFVSGWDSFLAEGADERKYRLLQGYKRAGDVLIQHALADASEGDNLIWPAVFNYRHYIELALKTIIEEHGPFAGISLGKERNHKLLELWQVFIKLAAAFGYDCLNATLTVVGGRIDEFADLDSRAIAFRYACDLDGHTPTLLSDGLDLVRLHDTMNGIENFFDCIDLDFTHKAEIAAEEWLARQETNL